MFCQLRKFLSHSSPSTVLRLGPKISSSIWVLLDFPWVDDWHSTCSLASSLSSLLSCKNFMCKWYHHRLPDKRGNITSACFKHLPSGFRCRAFYRRLATKSKDCFYRLGRRKSHSSPSKSSNRSWGPYRPSQSYSGEEKGSRRCYRTTKGMKTCC